MQSSTSTFLLDRLSFWGIAIVSLIGTLFFAGVYWALAALSPKDGLVPPSAEEILQWYDYLYFSFVTQATLGYGDFRPVGFSRIVACVHAIFGVVSAGVIVAKITTSSISRHRMLQKHACDNWIDIVRHADGRIELGALEMGLQKGNIFIAGQNYNTEGQIVDSFEAKLIEDEFPKSLTFRYRSSEAEHDYTEGYITVSFHASEEKAMSFSAVVRDHVKQDTKPIIRGWRVLQSEKHIYRKLARTQESAEAVKYFLDKYLSHVPELPEIKERAESQKNQR